MRRLPENPVLRPADVPPSQPDFEVAGAFNAGVARAGDEVLLLLRVAERPRERPRDAVVAPVWNPERGEIETLAFRLDDPELEAGDPRVFRHRGTLYLTSLSHLRLARSADGVRFSVAPAPAIFPESATESFGIEDPRVTLADGRYIVAYKTVSPHGIVSALAETPDFKSFTRRGVILPPETTNVAVFPERIAGAYVAWTRPSGRSAGPQSIWTARSPDLVHWGGHRPVLAPRPGAWDSARVGAAGPPMRTPEGWLALYHGADGSNRYSLGAALFAADDPARVLARSEEPVLAPEAACETAGFFGNVVFSCGQDVRPDGRVVIYYGAADEYTCAAETTLDEMMASLA